MDVCSTDFYYFTLLSWPLESTVKTYMDFQRKEQHQLQFVTRWLSLFHVALIRVTLSMDQPNNGLVNESKVSMILKINSVKTKPWK